MLIEKRQGTSVVQRQGRAPLGLGWRMLEMALNQVCGCRCRSPLSVVPGGGPGLDGMGVPARAGWESQLLRAGGNSRKLWGGSRCVQGRPSPSSLFRCGWSDGQVLSEHAGAGPRGAGVLGHLPTGLCSFPRAPDRPLACVAAVLSVLRPHGFSRKGICWEKLPLRVIIIEKQLRR